MTPEDIAANKGMLTDLRNGRYDLGSFEPAVERVTQGGRSEEESRNV